MPLVSFAGESTQSVGISFAKSYIGVCLEGAVIVLACVIYAAFVSTPTVSGGEATTMVWSYLTEIIFNMLVLVGLIKGSDRIIHEMMGLQSMQIPINKDIRRYQEEIFMGLTLRQLLCSGIAIGLAVLIYLWAKPLLGQETASWLCILAAAPIAAAGFLSYDGLPFEKFVIIVLESTILYSGWRVWKTELRPKQKGKVKKIAFK